MGNWPPTVTCRNVPGGFFYMIAGVVKLVDAADSKSAGAWLRAGSIPALGTRKPSTCFGRLVYLVLVEKLVENTRLPLADALV